jgi:membrane-bound lytic murein transglycosylase D
MKKGLLVFTGCLIMIMALASRPAHCQTEALASPSAAPFFLPATPTSLTLCGEKVPLDQGFVAEQLDREFNIAVHDRGQVVMWLKRAHRYFPYISEQLKKAGLPDDLKYLAVAESALLPKIRSYAGAVGLWQFIRGTGRSYGLRRNRYFDDRHNPEKATKAAVNYLRDLYKIFGNWALAMAAYNCGERRVKTAISEQGTRDYYHLYLPRETMRYNFRIMAAKVIISDPGKYGYNLPSSQLYKPFPAQRVTVMLRRGAHLRHVAKAASTSVRIIRELNPEIRGMILPRGKIQLKVPTGHEFSLPQSLKFASKKPVPSASGKRTYTVRRGDTLSRIAKKTRVKLMDLKRANNIRGSKIKPGQKLTIPD